LAVKVQQKTVDSEITCVAGEYSRSGKTWQAFLADRRRRTATKKAALSDGLFLKNMGTTESTVVPRL